MEKPIVQPGVWVNIGALRAPKFTHTPPSCFFQGLIFIKRWCLGWCGWHGWLAGWMDGWLTGWLAGLLAAWLAGWLAGWLVGWLAGWLAIYSYPVYFQALVLLYLVIAKLGCLYCVSCRCWCGCVIEQGELLKNIQAGK